MKLSPHFSLKEMTQNEFATRHNLDNTPDENVLKNLKFSCERMEQIRAFASAKLGRETPIVVYSGFRSLDVNRALGSDDNSAHIQGLAVDFGISGCTAAQTVELLEEMKHLNLISYTYLTAQQRSGTVGEWVHIDFADVSQDENLPDIQTVEITPTQPEKNPADWITEHFSWREMTRSDTAIRLKIKNIPNEAERANIKYCAEKLEEVRAYVSNKNGKDTGIVVTSCFRCELLNQKVGGAPSSAHRFGLAVDFDIIGYTSAQTAKLLKEMKDKGVLSYDQNILEFPKLGDGAWVHLGFKANPRHNRHQELTANKINGKTNYSAGLLA